MRPIKLTISAFGPYAKETEIILDEIMIQNRKGRYTT